MNSALNFTRSIIYVWLLLHLDTFYFIFKALEFIVVSNWQVGVFAGSVFVSVLGLALVLAFGVVGACRYIFDGVYFFSIEILSFKHAFITIVFFFKGFLVRFLKIFCRIQLLSLAFDTLRIGNLFEFPHVGLTAEVVLQ